MDYKLIICGGTFDRLHDGHKAFLRFAFSKGEKVIIGLTSDAYIRMFKPGQNILPFEERKKILEDFLHQEGFLQRATIVAIDSKFDQTKIRDSQSKALLVTTETEQSGIEINAERKQHGLPAVPLLVFPLVKNEKGEKISSSTIRKQHMDFPKTTRYLPEILRERLHQPFGLLFTGEIPKQFLKKPDRLVTVGDVTTRNILSLGIRPVISVIDFAIERKKTHQSLSDFGFTGDEAIVHVSNPPGEITAQVWSKLSKITKMLTKKRIICIVDGEEDLLVIPLILVLPVGFFILYGQPKINQQKEGVVVLEITEQLKEKTFQLLSQFTTPGY